MMRIIPTTTVCALTATATADFVGWTLTSRTVPGGSLINVFAATNSSSDVLLNVKMPLRSTPPVSAALPPEIADHPAGVVTDGVEVECAMQTTSSRKSPPSSVAG